MNSSVVGRALFCRMYLPISKCRGRSPSMFNILGPRESTLRNNRINRTAVMRGRNALIADNVLDMAISSRYSFDIESVLRDYTHGERLSGSRMTIVKEGNFRTV